MIGLERPRVVVENVKVQISFWTCCEHDVIMKI
jgi:hypothetical protein